jgi:hypothetical protein
LVRVFGKNLSDPGYLKEYLGEDKNFESLKLTENNTAIFVTASSQNTGEDQVITIVTRNDSTVEIKPVMQLYGNYLDIDNWAADNFIVTSSDFDELIPIYTECFFFE